MRRLTSEALPRDFIGRWTYGVPKVLYRKSGKTLTIGSFCSIAGGTQIFLGGEHRTDWITSYPFNIFWQNEHDIAKLRSSRGNVIIGSDVWIGLDCTILSGVSIGHGAVIGAGSMVVQDVPAYAIVYGNPAKLLRYRFDKEIVAALLQIAWWDWDDEKIKDFLPLLLSSNIEEFLNLCMAPLPKSTFPSTIMS